MTNVEKQLRDEFAKAALVGILSGSRFQDEDTENLAKIAFEIANEMLKRSKTL